MENIICTMDGVREDALGPPHCTPPAAVIANKLKPRSFKSSAILMRQVFGQTAVSAT